MSSIKPLGKYVICHRHEDLDDEIFKTSLALPESVRGRNQATMITDVGPDCTFVRPGDSVITRKLHKGNESIIQLDDNKWMIPEDMILLKNVFGEDENGHYRYFLPFGNNVLVKRLVRERTTASGIYIPENSDYLEQTPWCQIIEWGEDSPLDELYVNDSVGIAYVEWSTAITEVGLGGSSDDYYAIVPFEGIRFITDADLSEIDATDRQFSLYEHNFRKHYSKK